MRDNGEDRHNRPVKHTLTEAERKKLVERHFEAGAHRQAEDDLNLAKLGRLGEVLKRLKGG
jgi:hypothetical protein